jgi:cytochrome c oxidase cbb3-type subunit 3
MSDSNKPTGEIIEGHEYDGIQELDHPLPKWWLNLFYATIVFAVGYYAYYEFLGGPSHEEQYKNSLQKILAKKENQLPGEEIKVVTDEDLQALLKDPEALAVGKAAYESKCAACHVNDGGGLIGPNLTDKYWIHSSGDYDGILQAILTGFPDKGMPPWGELIPKEQHPSLVAYVISLQGTEPANPKEPQGELVE